jgi:hypothetical protein
MSVSVDGGDRGHGLTPILSSKKIVCALARLVSRPHRSSPEPNVNLVARRQ